MKNISSILFFIFFSSIIYAQEKDINSEFKNYSSSVFNSKEAALSLVSILDHKAQNDLNSRIQAGVQILQVGDFNKANAFLKSDETKVAITQNGESNELLLVKNAKTITQNVLQQGDSNKISDFTLHTNYNVNMEMIQNGDNQNIQNIGTNSLSKNMKITQTGNGASIILINY